MLNTYRADLHIHTLLSPCGDLAMSPANIIAAACKKGLDIIGISDHNSTRQAPLIQQLGAEKGIFVLCGAEVTSREEAHCLCFLPDEPTRLIFQDYLDAHLPPVMNKPDDFGYQVCVDIAEQIVFEEERLLISALNQSIEDIEAKVHALGGIFIPAHINRPRYSIISQLGFVPSDLNVDALELSRHHTISGFKEKNAYLANYPFIQSSDAHYIEDVGSVFTNLQMAHRSFDEIKKALKSMWL
jgi:PHP family Zn ribbon phosphoesterase